MMMTMSEARMALDDADLRRIGDYVKGQMYGWLAEVAPNALIGAQILERIERIEQQLVAQQLELKAQRELMEARFNAVDVRFEDMNKRFEDVNKRFEDMNKRFEDMNERFGDMNKRFSGMQWMVGGGFAFLGILMTVYNFIV